MEYKDDQKAVTRRELKQDLAATEASLKQDLAIVEAKFEDRFKKMDETIAHLPTKDEFFTAQEKLMTELKAIRQEQSMFVKGQDRHEKRIIRLEEHAGIGLVASF